MTDIADAVTGSDPPVEADDALHNDDGGPAEVIGGRSRLTTMLIAIIVVAVAVGAGATGWLVGHRNSGPHITASSIDAGFARDMSTHHTQAVIMAKYTLAHSTNPSVLLLASDIYEDQTLEIGQMQGWLDSWGLTRSSTIPVMAWMDGHDHVTSDGLMPGMATPDEITHLQTLTGNALDIDFLQLMIRHHQGGIPMEQYAEQHAQEPYVANLAATMNQAQSSEIISMEQLLRQLGGAPLAPPSS
jgi:uncharacterized protein (DUF305 family)